MLAGFVERARGSGSTNEVCRGEVRRDQIPLKRDQRLALSPFLKSPLYRRSQNCCSVYP
jgi:hypothetical protein